MLKMQGCPVLFRLISSRQNFRSSLLSDAQTEAATLCQGGASPFSRCREFRLPKGRRYTHPNMSEKILAAIAQFIIAVISKSGYLGVALLMGIESACVPLPSEIIMPFAGY